MLEEQNNTYYKIAYFFVANQVVFKRLAVVLLIILNIGLWGISGVKLVNYVANTGQHKIMLEQLAGDQIDWQSYHLEHQPKNIETLWVEKIKIGEKKYDLVAKINNPNEKLGAIKLTYAFVLDGVATDWQESFILPQSQKYLFKFSYISNTPPKQVDLKIRDIQWKKLSKLENVATLQTLIPKQKPEFSKTNSLSQIKFKTVNQTPYSFWQTGWQIILYKGDNQKPIAINYLTLNNFLAGQEREASASWPEALAEPTKVEILPDINLYDENNFIMDVNYSPVNLIRGARTRR